MADDCLKEKKSENPALVSQKVVFVRNLPLSANDQDLENVFTEIGPILNAFVVRDKGELLKFLSTCTWNNLSSGYDELYGPYLTSSYPDYMELLKIFKFGSHFQVRNAP